MFDVVIIITAYPPNTEELTVRNGFLTVFGMAGFEAQIIMSISVFGIKGSFQITIIKFDGNV